MFDRFRTRAFRRSLGFIFAILIVDDGVASGASLFAFDGAATHHPPRSVTDAEQPLIVALRAAINSYLTRRSATNATYRRPRARRLLRHGASPIECTVGDREDSTTNATCRLKRASTRIDH